jgi:hypothetical protein
MHGTRKAGGTINCGTKYYQWEYKVGIKKRSRLAERFFSQHLKDNLIDILVPIIESEFTFFEMKIKG